MKNIKLRILTIFIILLGISACGSSQSNVETSSLIDEQTAQSKGFRVFGEPTEDGTSYLSPSGDFVVFFQDQSFNRAFVTNGPTINIININGTVYVTNNEKAFFYNAKGCLVDQQEQSLDSEACKAQNLPAQNYNEVIDKYFGELRK